MTVIEKSAPATELSVVNDAGQKIFVRAWKPASSPRAILVICHGVRSHSGHYIWPAEQFAADGLAVYALDLRGRGRSEGDRFYIDTVDEYVNDLSTVIQFAKAREPGLPVYLLGHSAGGVVSSVYTLENQAELAGFICESFAFQVPSPEVALAIIKGVSHLLPHAPVLNLKNSDFSRDAAHVAMMDADPLIDGEVQPSSTVAALVRADERLKRDFPQITLPVLIMHGTADKVTVPAGSQLFFDTAGSKDKTLKLYPDHVHDLLADYGKEAVIGDMKAWIDGRISAQRS